MKVLITGAKGQLGRKLEERFRTSHELILTDIDELDIRDRSAVARALQQTRPDVVINCAAYTDVDGCEADPAKAFAINEHGARNVAEACAATGALLCHISTDYVFDGCSDKPYTENDIPTPLSVYGKSKLAGEQQVQKAIPRHLIVRTSWLFGVYGDNFIKTIIRLSETNNEIRVVNDQTGSPTYAEDLAVVIETLVMRPHAFGIYHVCNTGTCTWYSFAIEALALLGKKTRVVPITSHELGRPALRPRFSALDTSKFRAATGMPLRHWREALEAYFHKQKGVYR